MMQFSLTSPAAHRAAQCAARRAIRRGFSLVEVLLAVFILGIGMIMVATIFPVGADWTRQNAEETIASIVAKNAVALIQTKYTAADMASLNNFVQGVPGLPVRVPATERAYAFGTTQPFPAANPQNALYFWTAAIRRSPAAYDPVTWQLIPSSPAANHYDLYIFVFKKGAPSQQYTPATGELPYSRDSDVANSTTNELYIPYLKVATYAAGTYSSSTQTIPDAIPPVGTQGVGVTSGTAFRQGINPTVTPPVAVARPALSANDQVIYAPPADGNSPDQSPLVYIYQTTVSF